MASGCLSLDGGIHLVSYDRLGVHPMLSDIQINFF
jgi:hypothetical protein